MSRDNNFLDLAVETVAFNTLFSLILNIYSKTESTLNQSRT